MKNEKVKMQILVRRSAHVLDTRFARCIEASAPLPAVFSSPFHFSFFIFHFSFSLRHRSAP
jgi:hypothetical protein